jgi:hypothetical protein
MFRRKRAISREAVLDAWQPLPPDDPFVRSFAEPDEVVYNGVEAIDWAERMIPGTSRELTERLLVVTSRRLVVLAKTEGGIMMLPWNAITNIGFRRSGFQGFINVDATTSDGAAGTLEWSLHHEVAPVVADKMREFWLAAR